MAMKQGTIIVATLIAALSSTKYKEGKRDTEMHKTKKDNQWYYGIKVHIGVDKDTGMIHSVETAAANVHGHHVSSRPAAWRRGGRLRRCWLMRG